MRWKLALASAVGVTVTALILLLGGDGDGDGSQVPVDQQLAGDASVAEAVLEVQGLLGLDGASSELDPAVPESFPAQLDVCEEAQLVSTARGDWGLRASWSVNGQVADVAESVLGDWQQQGDWGLYYSGYLDFSSSTWGCVVQSDEGEVMVCLVDARDESTSGTCTFSLLWLGV